jgi:hypothetical protein
MCPPAYRHRTTSRRSLSVCSLVEGTEVAPRGACLSRELPTSLQKGFNPFLLLELLSKVCRAFVVDIAIATGLQV